MNLTPRSKWFTTISVCRRCKRRHIMLRHADDKPQPEVCGPCFVECLVDMLVESLTVQGGTDDDIPSANVQHDS